MVLLVLNKPLQARIEPVISQLPAELASQLAFYLPSPSPKSAPGSVAESQHSPVGTIEHDVIVRLSKWARKEKKEGAFELFEQGGRMDGELTRVSIAFWEWGQAEYYLSSLLKLTDVYAPPPPIREKSPALLEILSTLQASQDAASYASMTSLEIPKYRSLLPLNDIHENRTGVKTVAEEWAEVRREVGAIVNVGASMVAVAVAVWWVGGGRSNAARLGLSMGGAFAIGAIESFLYWRYFTQEQQQNEAGKKTLRKSVQKVPRFEGSLLSFEGMTKLGVDGKEA